MRGHYEMGKDFTESTSKDGGCGHCSTWMKAKVAAPVLAPPDMAAVSAAVCLSRAAPICSASPPAVPCFSKMGWALLKLLMGVKSDSVW